MSTPLGKWAETTRWSIQFTFVLLSIPAFFAGLYFFYLVDSLIPSLKITLRSWSSNFPPFSFSSTVFDQLVILWWYYLASIYAHYWFDKKKRFEHSFLISPRLYLLIFQLFCLLALWNDELDPNRRFALMLYMPFVSVNLTWWLSELFCRFKMNLNS
jgi:hypothetical protein